jgi:hypothetical protein
VCSSDLPKTPKPHLPDIKNNFKVAYNNLNLND